jgi:Na+/phosphate symporter
VDVLEGEILRYLARFRKQELSDEENRDVALSMKGADLFESVGDVIETELVNLCYRVKDEGIETIRIEMTLPENLKWNYT